MKTYSKLTIAEIYPMAYEQDLLKKQSEHFIDKIIINGNFENGYDNIPVELTNIEDKLPLIVTNKPPQLLIFNYLKNNWKPLLIVGIGAALLVSAYYKTKQRKEKKPLRKPKPKNIILQSNKKINVN
jgi:hypothetical protein